MSPASANYPNTKLQGISLDRIVIGKANSPEFGARATTHEGIRGLRAEKTVLGRIHTYLRRRYKRTRSYLPLLLYPLYSTRRRYSCALSRAVGLGRGPPRGGTSPLAGEHPKKGIHHQLIMK